MAAGQGFKTFTTGEVLTAGDVNGYLMQGINVFATTTARNAAITAPAEGQFAFTKDTNSLWYYDGAAWVASGATGDIEGVTAGVGISGGGTSGTVTVTNSMATAIDAKGDLVPGTGADTFARLAVGANGTVLTADSAEATGLKWVAAAGGGKVLQVVSSVITASTTIASISLTDTSITATITPTSATSKILVIVNAEFQAYRGANEVGSRVMLLRDGGSILDYPLETPMYFRANGATAVYFSNILPVTYLDSPATTSATTYKIQSCLTTTANSASITYQFASAKSVITLIEIGA
jgi:hypothetical protein